MLVLTRKLHEKIMIGDDIVVMVTALNDNKVSLGIEAPAEIRVDREEIRDLIRDQAGAAPAPLGPPAPPAIEVGKWYVIGGGAHESWRGTRVKVGCIYGDGRVFVTEADGFGYDLRAADLAPAPDAPAAGAEGGAA